MIERGRGHIIAINSSAGLVPNTQMVPYCAAKYGLRGNRMVPLKNCILKYY